MELNREQIIKALECCSGTDDDFLDVNCNECPYKTGETSCRYLDRNALALIKELAEEKEAWQKQLIAHEETSGKAYYELACEVEDLRKENENLHASCTKLTEEKFDIECSYKALKKDNERLYESCTEFERSCTELTQTCTKLTEENERLRAECVNQSLLWKKHFESIYETAKETVKADTVRKMQERIYAFFDCENDYQRCSHGYIRYAVDQIAKEMLEGL